MGFDPQQAAADWAAGLAAAGPKIQRGIMAVTVAPGAAAARQKGAYTAGVAAAADKWAARVGSVSLGDWQQAAVSKGGPRIAQGATAAQPKMAAFLTRVAPHIASGVAALPPRGSIEQNLQRSAQFARHMAGFQNRG